MSNVLKYSGLSILEYSTAEDSPEVIYVNPGQSIQQAINSAKWGDTIQVAKGTYNERLTIRKGLTLVGSGNGDTVINGGDINSGICVYVTARDVVIHDLSLTNCFGALFIPGSTNVTASKLNIYKVKDGVVLLDSRNLSIQKNIITDTIYGFTAQSTRDSIFFENHITRSIMGLWLYDSHRNIVKKNYVDTDGYTFGIQLNAGSSGNTVFKNDLKDNYWGFYMEAAGGNQIYLNDFCFNRRWDVYERYANTNYFDKNSGERTNILGACDCSCKVPKN